MTHRFANCRWIPWAVALCFVVVFGVNGALAYFAVHSDPGLVTEHPFELGTGYNRVLDAGAAQDALGWRGTVEWLPDAARHGTVSITVEDADGRRLAGLAMAARLVRPVEKRPPVELVLAETAPGRYAAQAAPALPGQWEVRVVARQGKQQVQFQQRILVP
jgi:nitrogen fixation protein FixH